MTANSLSDAQPQLMELLTGTDQEQFMEIAPFCTQCKLLAVDAYNCFACQGQIICGICVEEKGRRFSKECGRMNQSNPATQECSPNLLARKIIERALFKCPNKCKARLRASELHNHLQHHCEKAKIPCPQECGLFFPRKAMEDHIRDDCVKTAVHCDQCGHGRETRTDLGYSSSDRHSKDAKSSRRSGSRGKINVAPVFRREQLKKHLAEDCKGISSCQYCPAKYRKGMQLPGKDYAHCCEDYMARLLEEIVGPSVFNEAKEKLNRRLTNRDKLLTGDPTRLAPKDDGLIQNIVSTEIENSMSICFDQIQVLRDEVSRLKNEQVDRLERTEKFIENQRLANDFFKPFISAEQRYQTIKRLDTCGSPVTSNGFEWPSPSDLRLVTLSELIESRLHKIEYHVGGSIWSMRLTMTDGRQSPTFGTRQVLDAMIVLDPTRDIGRIEVLESTDKKYVNSIIFYEQPNDQERALGQQGPMLGIIQGADNTGHWRVFDLEPNTQILGIHGSLNSAPNIRSLGFLTWSVV